MPHHAPVIPITPLNDMKKYTGICLSLLIVAALIVVYWWLRAPTASYEETVTEEARQIMPITEELPTDFWPDTPPDDTEEDTEITRLPSGDIDYVAHPELWTNVVMAPIGDPVPDEDFSVYVDEAIRVLQSEDATEDDKLDVLENIGLIYDPMVMPAVMIALQDESFEVRMEAVEIMRFLDHPCIVPAVELALSDASPEVRMYAIEALTLVNDISINPLLERALWDEDENVREQAVEILLIHESPTSLPVIEIMLGSTDSWYHEEAIEALQSIPAPEAIDMLIDRGFSGSAEAADMAQAFLETISGQSYGMPANWRAWWDQVKVHAPPPGNTVAWEAWLETLKTH